MFEICLLWYCFLLLILTSLYQRFRLYRAVTWCLHLVSFLMAWLEGKGEGEGGEKGGRRGENPLVCLFLLSSFSCWNCLSDWSAAQFIRFVHVVGNKRGVRSPECWVGCLLHNLYRVEEIFHFRGCKNFQLLSSKSISAWVQVKIEPC